MSTGDGPRPAKQGTSPGVRGHGHGAQPPAAGPPQAPLVTSPSGEPLPLAYRWLRAGGLYRLPPWTFLDDPGEVQRLRGEFVREVAPPNDTAVRDLVPFAERRDRDEVAGFAVDGGRVTVEVVLVALTWKGRPEQRGWPALQRFRDLWLFVREALLEDAQEWANEESLQRLLHPRQ
jgi:hypothetical protein